MLRAGDVLLFRNHDLFAWIAQTATHAPVNHAAILAPCGCCQIAAEGNGVRLSALPRLPDPDVFVLPAADPVRGLAAAQAAATQLGDGYDYAAYVPLLARLLHRALPDALKPHMFICSALVTWALREAGIDPCPGLDTRTVTPADLFLALAQRGEERPAA